jgi:hypothetical protein
MIERRAVIGSTSKGVLQAPDHYIKKQSRCQTLVFHLLRYFGGIARDWSLISGVAVLASW